MSDRLAVLTQYLLPKQALTALAGKAANAAWGKVTTNFIRWFVDVSSVAAVIHGRRMVKIVFFIVL